MTKQRWLALAGRLVVCAVGAASWGLLPAPPDVYADQGNCFFAFSVSPGPNRCQVPNGLSVCSVGGKTGGVCDLGPIGQCECERATVPRTTCAIGFTFNSPQVEPGSTLTGFLDVNCSGAFGNGSAFLYLAVRTPTGDLAFVVSDGTTFGPRFQTMPSPVRITPAAGVKSFRVPMPVFPVPNNIRPGRYTFLSVLSEPATDLTELISSPLNFPSPIASSDVIIQQFGP